MFFKCCTLYNMLHAFDGMDVVEAGVECEGKDGFNDLWDADPLRDESKVRSSDVEKVVEVDSGRVELNNELIATLRTPRTTTTLFDVDSRPSRFSETVVFSASSGVYFVWGLDCLVLFRLVRVVFKTIVVVVNEARVRDSGPVS